jgi:hypothetical protein
VVGLVGEYGLVEYSSNSFAFLGMGYIVILRLLELGVELEVKGFVALKGNC